MAVDARLARIEQIVDVTALEAERMAEAQRHVAISVLQQRGAPSRTGRTPERVNTPY